MLRFIAYALVLTAGTLGAQAPALENLSAIRLRVNLDAQATVPISMDTAMLMREIQAELAAHGWRVARDRKDDSVAIRWPALVIEVHTFEYRAPNREPTYITRYDYGLTENAKTTWRDSPERLARTWSGPAMVDAAGQPGQVFQQVLAAARRIVRQFNEARGPLGRRA